MLLGIANDGQFVRFCAAAGLDWADDTRFATNTDRVMHRAELIPMVEQVTATRTSAEWVELLESKAVPCGPINDIGQAFADPQVRARGLRVEQERYPDGQQPPTDPINRIASAASPLRLQDTPPTLRYAPPALGQHTDEVLRERLGLSAEQLRALHAQGVV